jgi:hypothetical protein
MADIFLMKTADNKLVPIDDEAHQFISKYKSGDKLKAKITKPRNYEFHKKAFALINMGYEYYEPPEQLHNGVIIAKSFESYRKGLIITSGFYKLVVGFKGNLVYEAESLSFESMAEDRFQIVYKAMFHVVWNQLLFISTQWTREEMERVLGNAEGFV